MLRRVRSSSAMPTNSRTGAAVRANARKNAVAPSLTTSWARTRRNRRRGISAETITSNRIMAHILTFKGKTPKIGSGVFLAPNASLIGDVEIGDGASVWFGAVLRGDEAGIRIGARTSVQDNVVIHVYEGHDTIVEDDVTIGHGAILEACRI